MEATEKPSFTLHWSGHTLRLDERTHIMGVLNVTPDSFSNGGQFYNQEKAIEHGLMMAEEGADIVDVGGESTRPYSRKIPVEEELGRIIPVIRALGRELRIPISIDTYKSAVARAALDAGASMINDTSALRADPRMAEIAAREGVPVVLMHMKGTPLTMQDNPTYDDLIPEILTFLGEAVERAEAKGIKREMILIDPGIGFGKTFDHNLQIIKELARFQVLGRPLVLGTSRKAFIGHILDKPPQGRDTGTLATVVAGVMNGANVVRVHNVKETHEVVKVADAIRRGKVR